MKKLSTLLLGSAAAVSMMTSGALAADIPADEPAVAVCDAFGTGFWVIPGTSNCIKIGGMVRANYAYNFKGKDKTRTSSRAVDLTSNTAFRLRTATDALPVIEVNQAIVGHSLLGDDAIGTIKHPAGAIATRDDSTFTLSDVNTNNIPDARFNSEWYGRIGINFDVRSMTEWGVLRAYASWEWTGHGEKGAEKNDGPSLANAYIEFAGLTAGFRNTYFPYDSTLSTMGDLFDGSWDTVVLAYTFAAGNGISATLSLEDPDRSYYDNGFGNLTFREDAIPDVVAAFKIAQSWGNVHLAGIVHTAEVNHNDWDRYTGYAVTAGTTFNIPMLEGSSVSLSGAYASGFMNGLGVGVVPGAGKNATGLDDVMLNGTDVDKTSGWAVNAGLKVKASDEVTFAVGAGYHNSDNDYNNISVKAYRVSGSVSWTPVTDLSFKIGIEHANADYEEDVLTNAGDGGDATKFDKSLVVHRERDISSTYVNFRVQRDF